ncbi:MAG: response regulator [Armatimonadetes bacterium]|nr:response regulator [Armatimonadota bacterium]
MRRVLVVQNQKHIARLIQTTLERSGQEVTVVETGSEGLHLLQTEKFDQAIVDYTMSHPNGYELLEFIRTNDETRMMSVVLIVNSPSQYDHVQSLPFRADVYTDPRQNPFRKDRKR